MAGRIGLEVTPAALTVEPGGAAHELTVVARNDGNTVERLVLSIVGLEPDWYRLPDDQASLFPGDQVEVRITVQAPADALAGPRPFQVRAVVSDASETALANVALEVAPIAVTTALTLQLTPARQQVRGGARATYAIALQNARNADQSLQLVASDPDDALELRLAAEDVLVPARGTRELTLTARPRRRPLAGDLRAIAFSLAALSADDPLAPPLAGADGELAHMPLLAPLLQRLPRGTRQRAMLAAPLLAALAIAIWLLGQPGQRGPDLPAPPPTPAVAASPAPVAAKPAEAPPASPASATSGAPGAPPEIVRFGLNQPMDDAPAFLPLAWEVRNAEHTTLERTADDQGVAPRTFKPIERAEYTLQASNAAGETSRSLTLYVLRPPVIDTFDGQADSSSGRVVLRYHIQGADQATLGQQPLPDAAEGNIEVTAVGDGIYELRAQNAAGVSTRRITLQGAQAAPAPPGASATPANANATATATATPQEQAAVAAAEASGETPTPRPADSGAASGASASATATATGAPVAAVPPTGATATLTPLQAPPQQAPTATSSTIPATTPPTATRTLAPTATRTPTPRPAPPPPTDTATPTLTPLPAPPAPVTTPVTAPPQTSPRSLPGIPGIPGPIDSNDTRFGIAEGFRNVAVMTEIGANWERVILPWPAIQPTAVASFSGLGQSLPQDRLNSDLGRGVKVAGLLQFTPGWAQANPSQGERSPPRNLNLPYNDPNNYWARYVSETVRAYAGQIDEWIIWNEPEFKPGDAGAGGSFTWQGTDEEFAQLLKVGYLAAKAANPNAVVSFPGTSYWVDQLSNRAQFYERIMQILARDPDAARFNYYHDAVALNIYRNPDDILRVHQVFKDIQHAHGFDKPIWLSETNAMPSDDTRLACNHADDGIATTMDQQASFGIQALAMGAAAGYTRVDFYQMIDNDPCTQPAVWGVTRDDGSKRPVADALRTLITNVAGFARVQFLPLARTAQAWPTWPDEPTSFIPNWQVYQVAFDIPEGPRVTVLWNGDAQQVRARIRKTGSSATLIDKRGAQSALQDVQGWWVVDLAGATAHYAQDPPGYFFIGGDPVLIVERGVPFGAPLAPPALGNPGSAAPGFELAVNPAGGQTVATGAPAEFFVNVVGVEGFAAPVTWRITQWSSQRFPDPHDPSTLPLAVTLPRATQPGQTATIHIESAGADPGIYYLTLAGSGGGIDKSVELALVLD